MKTKGLVLPPDFGLPAAPVAIITADADQIIDLLVAQGLAGRVDATSSHTALQITDNELNPSLITIEMGRNLSRELGADLTLLRELQSSDPEETANFVIHPDGSFWPVPVWQLPALMAQIPTMIGTEDAWFVAHRPTGKGANAPATPPVPNGLRAVDPMGHQEWVAAGVHSIDQNPPSSFLAALEWAELTALIRVTGQEVTIWRTGKGSKALLPLSWGYHRTWVHPKHGVRARDPKVAATAFAASWRRAGGSVSEATLVELHQRSCQNNAVLRPALSALGLPSAIISQLCAQIPATPLSLPTRSTSQPAHIAAMAAG